MSYSTYLSREVFEDNGTLALLKNSKSEMYTIKAGEKVFFEHFFIELYKQGSLPYNMSRMRISNNFVDQWDYLAVERVEDEIILILRDRLDNLSSPKDINKWVTFKMLRYDLEGNYVGAGYNSSNVNVSGTTLQSWVLPNSVDSYQAKESLDMLLKKKKIKAYSELEKWVIDNSNLWDEYITTSEKSPTEGRPNSNGRLEEWAYYKYKELYPDQPMLEGFGVKDAKKSNSGNSTNSDKNTLYEPSKFNKKSADKITNFNPSVDTLEIDTDSFGIDSSATFASGKNVKAVKKKLANKDFDFLYDEKKGGLYFNENGADKGFGDGGLIAILKGAPDLTANNLEFI